jgi:hypothetical protein
MERFSLEVLACGVVASCLSLFGFLGFTFWWRGSGSRELNLMVCLVVRGFVAMSDASNLLAHEAAFALGQMQDVAAIPALCTVLQDTSSFHPIVRHEVSMYVPPANFLSLADDCIISSPFICEGFVLLHVNSFFVLCFRGSKVILVYLHV